MRGGLFGAVGFAAALMLAGTAAEATAQLEFESNFSVVSDYVFRGITQSQERPAVQGGLDVSLTDMIYAGLWGSSVNFGEDLAGGRRASAEVDLYAGIAPMVGPIALDLGGIFYAYPGAAESRNYNFFEVAGSAGLSLGPLTPGVTVAYSPDFFGGSGSALWTAVDANIGLANTPISIDAYVGRQTIEDEATFGIGEPDYIGWSLGGTVNIFGLDVGAGVTGTDLGEAECNNTEFCSTRFVFSVGR